MQIKFDFWDFTKSAWSLASGIFAVFLLALMRSPIDLYTLILTLGLSVGVIVCWGLCAVKAYLQNRDAPSFQREHLPEASPPAQTQEGLPSQAILLPYVGPELMPSYEPISQRLRPLLGRSRPIDGLGAHDQWHHS